MSERLIKSKERVKAHGEVFTPAWMVEKMLDLVKDEANDVYKTFLEPAAGDGNFLVAILRRKLKMISVTYETRYCTTKALFALSSIYGIEIQKDNLREARQAMLEEFIKFHVELKIPIDNKSSHFKAARHIIHENIVWGDTLKKLRPDGSEIIFNEWKPITKNGGRVERIPYTFSSMFTNEESNYKIPQAGQQLSLFDLDEPIVEDKPIKYKIVDIKNVWKEELEHGE